MSLKAQSALFAPFENARVATLHKLDFLTSASQLAPVQPDKVSDLELTFRTVEFQWQTSTDDDGNTVRRLVSA
jgi:hypothetical protein